MTLNRSDLKWNGWGRLDAPDPLAGRHAAAFGWLMRLLDTETLPETPAADLAHSIVPTAVLPASIIADLSAIVGAEHIAVDEAARARFARGQSYHDLLWLRSGALDLAPDAVIVPRRAEDVAALLDYAGRRGIACIPRGGGTSVVGGVSALPGAAHIGAIVLDLAALDTVHEIRAEDRLARIGAGCDGPALERALGASGFTLGHYPQSFEFSTLGGWIAHAGAGQQSYRYGRAEDWLHSARLATPTGLWSTDEAPASAAGPRLKDLVAGSEGLFGVITDATVHLTARPASRRLRAFLFKSFGEGAAAIRAMVQAGADAATLRLSDAAETGFYQAFGAIGAAPPALLRRLVAARLRARGYLDAPASLIAQTEGEASDAGAAMAEIARHARAHGGVAIGSGPAERWYHGRFQGPYLRDPLMDRGLGADTLETATSWSNLLPLHQAVTAALNDAMQGHGTAFGHISHAYPDGASLYFTYIFLRDLEKPVRQWHRIKAAASDAIIAAGGTISHHHGVGQDHLPWIAKERDATSLAILRAVKRRLDPNGVMNPGKLLPDAPH